MTTKLKALTGFLPMVGILIFCTLYVYSASLYPGGSQADLNSTGFDYVNNYWCNLTSKYGMNGLLNPAKPFAVTAMVILCPSLALFFIQFSNNFAKHLKSKFIIKTSGVLSMLFSVLIFTSYHDLMTIISSIFGVFVVIGIIWEIFKSNLILFKLGGAVCIFLLAINNSIYYSSYWVEFLPLIQKITFVFILGWIVGLNFKIVKTTKKL